MLLSSHVSDYDEFVIHISDIYIEIKMANTGKYTKNICNETENMLKHKIDNSLRDDHNICIQMKNMPHEYFKAFVGRIRYGDITALAAFAIVNNLQFETVKMILEIIQAERKNTIGPQVFLHIRNKIASIQRSMLEYINCYDMTELDKFIAEIEGAKIPDNLPDYYSFDCKNGVAKHVSGKILHNVESYRNRMKKDKKLHQKDRLDTSYGDIMEIQTSLLHNGPVKINIMTGETRKREIIISLDENNIVNVNTK